MNAITAAAKVALSFVSFAALVAAGVSAVRGAWLWCVSLLAAAVVLDLVSRWWSRRAPIPMPPYAAWVLFLPRGQSPRNLLRNLQPRAGESILEIGPGVGVHSIPVAEALRSDGVLHVLDVQQEMLDRLRERATRRGINNIVAKCADARQLPYDDATFDAAFLLSVLGEIGDAPQVLRELQRVLKPGGRLVIGEAILDPDFISLRDLRVNVEAAGFVLENTRGPSFSYMAAFRVA